MTVIKPGFEILDRIDGAEILKKIELCGRTCYKSEDRITDGSAEKLIRRVISSGHESVIEHEKITVKIICDRGVSHEIVRHRIASYSQESTRYCNYGKVGELTFIQPSFFHAGSQQYRTWRMAMDAAEDAYLALLNQGATPEHARSVLPNSLKTEIVVTMNLREWRHFLKLRTAKDAHPQLREIAIPLLAEFQRRIPVVFDDIVVDDTR